MDFFLGQTENMNILTHCKQNDSMTPSLSVIWTLSPKITQQLNKMENNHSKSSKWQRKHRAAVESDKASATNDNKSKSDRMVNAIVWLYSLKPNGQKWPMFQTLISSIRLHTTLLAVLKWFTMNSALSFSDFDKSQIGLVRRRGGKTLLWATKSKLEWMMSLPLANYLLLSGSFTTTSSCFVMYEGGYLVHFDFLLYAEQNPFTPINSACWCAYSLYSYVKKKI